MSDLCGHLEHQFAVRSCQREQHHNVREVVPIHSDLHGDYWVDHEVVDAWRATLAAVRQGSDDTKGSVTA